MLRLKNMTTEAFSSGPMRGLSWEQYVVIQLSQQQTLVIEVITQINLRARNRSI